MSQMRSWFRSNHEVIGKRKAYSNAFEQALKGDVRLIPLSEYARAILQEQAKKKVGQYNFLFSFLSQITFVRATW